MSQNPNDPTQDAQVTTDQTQPETGVDQDPSQNTAPPSNPPVDQEALEKGKENLDSVVSW
ncbi:MAG TPA: hypothetical protein VF533_18265 [Solirubrobacteraceae bacterium]|jgi:hypothetical protein